MPFCTRNRLDRIEEKLEQLLVQQHTINPKLETFMAMTQAELDAILSTVQTDLSTLQTDNAAVIAKLQSIQPGQPAPDFTAEVTQLQSIDAALNALASADTSATAPATGTTGSASTTGAAASAVKGK